MKFTSFFSVAPLFALSLGADIDVLRADATALAYTCATFGTRVTAFPVDIGAGSVQAVQGIAEASAQVVVALNRFVVDASALTGPVTEADGLALVDFLSPVGQGYIATLLALQGRKPAIAALPSLGVVNALSLIRQALTVVKGGSQAFKDAMAQRAFIESALEAWIALADSVIDQETATIAFFASV
ncbi:hypothetical protein H0H87_000749 [Tephrocybe sp. NHM501043]|nr:hypothetical protein H0H87_000749 [Tephrocybe sp. NHM501043]